MDLPAIRKKLDALDARLVLLLARRQSYMKEVAQYKERRGLPINQPGREREVLRLRRQQGSALGLDPKLIRTVFCALFDDAKAIQRRVGKK